MARDVEDSQLLNTYATERSEAAFQALVERHVGLVYATASRQLGNAALAQEVTQNVFIALARRPHAFRHESTLAGWFYKTALLQARQCIRSELRRKRREEVAVELGTVAGNTDSIWEPLVPLLDEALLSLRETDRLAVVLRFLEARPLREVGSTLGISEDAAQKRVTKALETLTAFFRRRGFAVPALAASAPLWHDAVKAVPYGMAAGVTQIALQQATLTPLTGATLILAKLMTLTKTQTAAVCLLVGALPVAVEWHSLENARAGQMQVNTELQSARAELTDAESQHASLLRRKETREAMLAALQQRTREQTVAAATPVPTEPESYPWSEESDFVRVPKRLLSQVSIWPPMQTKLSDGFIAVLRLTPEEVEGINAAFAEGKRQYQLLVARHLEPTDEHMTFPRDEGTVEKFSFRLTPFVKEGAALQENHEKLLRSILGEERFNLYWEQLTSRSGPLTRRERSVFGSYGADGSQTTYTYMLTESPVPSVVLGKGSWSGGASGGGGGGGAGPLNPAEDEFAPEVMKPILARWRARMEELKNQPEAQRP